MKIIGIIRTTILPRYHMINFESDMLTITYRDSTELTAVVITFEDLEAKTGREWRSLFSFWDCLETEVR